MSEPWQEFAVYSDAVSAEVAAGRLRSEGVPVDVLSERQVPGLMEAYRLRVPVEMMRRAEWVAASADDFTEEELAFIATGRLNPDQGEQ
jgi:hypothetical protein